MNDNNQRPFTYDSTLLNSLDLHTNTSSILSSTKNHEPTSINLAVKSRRKGIIPTPNRPTIISQSVSYKYPDDELPSHRSDNQTDIEHYPAVNISSNHLQQDIATGCNQNQPPMEENEEENDFDMFILEHFSPFSGKQSVTEWLDETESTFKQLKISRHLRFQSISLLVEGDAKRLYIKHRAGIRSFDDFYEFLLLNFDITHTSSSQIKSHSTCPQDTTHSHTSCPHASIAYPHGQSADISNITNFARQPPAFHSNALVDFGATNTIGESLDNRSTNITTNSSISIFDQTTNDLRKAILEDLIKNPKVFKGSKDDVNKWIDDIEHLLDVAHIPDPSRLDIISYSLRGDALQWYKNNKTTFTSWAIFVHELKRAFTSSFHEELAFKKLEIYTQGENQLIRNFFNEVLKLCKEADSTMSESTKLKNLLNKAKPTIQFEVRKKKPTTTAEFLEYAKDVEELFQLSNINLNNQTNRTSAASEEQQMSPLKTEPTANTRYVNNSFAPKFSSGYSNNYNNNSYRNTYTNQDNRSNYPSSTFTPSSFRSPQSSQFQPRSNASRFPSNRYNSSLNSSNTYRPRTQPYQPNSSNLNQRRPPTANTIFSSDPTLVTEEQPEAISSIVCTQCNEFGHEASTCSNF